MNQNPAERSQLQSPKKKKFVSPKVTLLGSIVELTAGPAGGSADGFFGGSGGFQALS